MHVPFTVTMILIVGVAAGGCHEVAPGAPMPGSTEGGDSAMCDSAMGTRGAVAVACGQRSPAAIAVSAESIYWANTGDPGAMLTMPLTGGTPTEPNPVSWRSGYFGVLVDTTRVYWTVQISNNGGIGIVWAPLQGATLQRGFAGDPFSRPVPRFTVDTNSLYWADAHLQRINEQSLSDFTQSKVLATGEGSVVAMAVRDNELYWTVDSEGDGGLGAIHGVPVDGPVDGGGVAVLVNLQAPRGIAAGSDALYWTNGPSVMSMPLAGGTVTILASLTGAVDGVNDGWIALDDTYVYWTYSAGGTVTKVPRAGGDTSVMASGQAAPRGIAVDATHIYWANSGDGTIVSMPK
jgi:hypothetical protein